MNLRNGRENTLLQKRYRICERCGRVVAGDPPALSPAKNLWVRGNRPAGDPPAATLDP